MQEEELGSFLEDDDVCPDTNVLEDEAVGDSISSTVHSQVVPDRPQVPPRRSQTPLQRPIPAPRKVNIFLQRPVPKPRPLP